MALSDQLVDRLLSSTHGAAHLIPLDDLVPDAVGAFAPGVVLINACAYGGALID